VEDKRIRSGLTSYLSTGKFTPEFIDDVEAMISKVFKGWSLYEDRDEFSSFCWAKIVKALQIFDKNVSSLYTYLSQVIYNEAQRIYSKHKRMAYDNIDESREKVEQVLYPLSEDRDLLLRDRLRTFACMAYKLSVFVDQRKLKRNYLLGNLTPAVRAFMWVDILNRNSKSNSYSGCYN